MTEAPSVVATFNYTAPMDAEPEIYFYEPDDGRVKHDPVADPRPMRVRDARGQESAFTLDADGFALVDIAATLTAFDEREAVKAGYYPAVAERVKAAVGAAHVHVFDHNFRSREVTEKTVSNSVPVTWVHNDFTELSGPQRVRDLMGDSAEDLLTRRFMFINLWRPVGRVVEEFPLGVCAAGSVKPSDFVILALRYKDRDGQIYFARHNPDHDWVYVSHMRPDEALLLKCYDSERDGRARWTMHSAFEDPTSPADAPPRVSIEARTIAFFD